MLPFVGHTRPVRCVAFAPDGDTLVSGGSDHRVLVWDRHAGRERHAVAVHVAPRGVACHPDGEHFAAPFRYYPSVLGSADRVRLWSLTTGKVAPAAAPAAVGYWQRAAVAVAGADPWEVELPEWAVPLHLYFGGTGRLLALLADRDPTAINLEPGRVVEFATTPPHAEPPSTWLQRRSQVKALTLSADGQTAAVASRQYVRVGRLDADRVPPGYAARGVVHSLALTPDGSRLIGCWGSSVTAWDTAAAGELREFAGHTAPVEAVAAHPDGRLVASASLDGTVMLWDVDSGGVRARYDWGLGPVHALAFAPDGLTLAVAGDGGLVAFDVE